MDVGLPCRPGYDGEKPGKLVLAVRYCHCIDEVILEPWLNRRLDLFDTANRSLDLVSGLNIQKSDGRAGPGGVARRFDFVGRTIRDESEDHGVAGVDVRPESTSEPDAVRRIDTGPVHQ